MWKQHQTPQPSDFLTMKTITHAEETIASLTKDTKETGYLHAEE